MADFPYTPNPPNVGKFLDHVRDSGVPAKVTVKHLETVGFKSKNDRYLVGVLKAIDFIDSNGVPTSRWKAYKDRKQAPSILATSLMSSYSELFSIYPDAYRKDDEALNNYFASQTGLAKATVERIVRTFKVLCERADFEAPSTPQRGKPPTPAEPPPKPLASSAIAPTIAINVQLQLPETEKTDIYDALFAAMKKHLFS